MSAESLLAHLPPLLTARQVASTGLVSEQTLSNWRSTRSAGPPFCKINDRVVRYPKDQLVAWLDAKMVVTAKGGGE